MVQKTISSGNDKSFSLNWKVFSQRNISETSTGTTRSSFPPSGFIEQRGVVICRTAPCLKKGVRERERSFKGPPSVFSVLKIYPSEPEPSEWVDSGPILLRQNRAFLQNLFWRTSSFVLAEIRGCR
jgi:hypothetical protein